MAANMAAYPLATLMVLLGAIVQTPAFSNRSLVAVAPTWTQAGSNIPVLLTLGSPDPASNETADGKVTLRLVGGTTGNMLGAMPVFYEKTTYINGKTTVPVEVPVPRVAQGRLLLLYSRTFKPTIQPTSNDDLLQSPIYVSSPLREILIYTDRKVVCPGDTVRVWLVALSRTLRLSDGFAGVVRLRDPAGTPVCLWEGIKLSREPAVITTTISPRASPGLWTIDARVYGFGYTQFNATIRVVSETSSETSMMDDADWGWPMNINAAPWSPVTSTSTPTSVQRAFTLQTRGKDALNPPAASAEHYVELRFSPGMRRLFKPGLPFEGQVEAISSEKCVRVRVKLFDNTTAIYSQDLEVAGGSSSESPNTGGRFVVPAILADGDVVTVQAELVAVDGKEIDSHYVLARELLRRWNATSPCFLQLATADGQNSQTITVGETVYVRSTTTCGCTAPFSAVAATAGQITFAANVTSVPEDVKSDPASPCQRNVSLLVTSDMVPSTSLLVYHVADNGEHISDIVHFRVRLPANQIAVNWTHREHFHPSSSVRIQIRAAPDSFVCLVIDRWPTPANLSEPADSADTAESAEVAESTTAKPAIDNAQSDFEAIGLTLARSRLLSEASSQPPSSGPPDRLAAQLEQLAFSEVWSWTCFNYTASVEEKGVKIELPERAGSWRVTAVAQPPEPLAAMATSQPLSPLHVSTASRPLIVFRPLGVALKVPPSLRIGETLELPVKIVNNIDSCVDVAALLSLSGGARFLSSGTTAVSERLRLGPQGATSLVVRLQASASGPLNLTAEVTSRAAPTCLSRSSTPSSASNENAEEDVDDSVTQVLRTATINISPEGLQRTHIESAFFCANERALLVAGDAMTFIPAPRNRDAVVLELHSPGPVRVALDATGSGSIGDAAVTANEDSPPSLLLVLGHESWLSRGDVRVVGTSTPGLLGRPVWVSWEHGEITVGRGSVIGKEEVLRWIPQAPAGPVRRLGFAAANFGDFAQVRVWNYNAEAGFSQVLHLQLPRGALPGSEDGALLVAGGVVSPGAVPPTVPPTALSPSNNSELTSPLSAPLPTNGLGEATGLWAAIARIAPVVSLGYYPNLPAHIQILLHYRNRDGGFADHTGWPSLRATIAALDALANIRTRYAIDPDLTIGTMRWVIKRQRDDGSFDLEPADVAELQGSYGDAGRIIATAEALSAILQLPLFEIEVTSVQRARYFLELQANQPLPVDALAVLTAALAAAGSPVTTSVVKRLRTASTNREGDFSWESIGSGAMSDWVMARPSSPAEATPATPVAPEPSTLFRASLWTLIAHCQRSDLASAEPVARYLFYHAGLLDAHPELAWLQARALSAFRRLSADPQRSLTVSLATSGMELTDTLEVRAEGPSSAAVLRRLPTLPTKAFVYATGAGCATVQGQVHYSTYAPESRSTALELHVSAEDISVKTNGGAPLASYKSCFRWLGSAERQTPVLRLDVSLHSGYDLDSNVTANGIEQINVRSGFNSGRVWITFVNAPPMKEVCAIFRARAEYAVGSLRPALARISPVGKPALATEVIVRAPKGSALFPEDVLPYITEESKPDIPTSKPTSVPSTTTSAPSTTEVKTNDVVTAKPTGTVVAVTSTTVRTSTAVPNTSTTEPSSAAPTNGTVATTSTSAPTTSESPSAVLLNMLSGLDHPIHAVLSPSDVHYEVKPPPLAMDVQLVPLGEDPPVDSSDRPQDINLHYLSTEQLKFYQSQQHKSKTTTSTAASLPLPPATNRFWGIFRDVSNGNRAGTDVLGSVTTISEQTKDEDQQDKDEVKLTFD